MTNLIINDDSSTGSSLHGVGTVGAIAPTVCESVDASNHGFCELFNKFITFHEKRYGNY